MTFSIVDHLDKLTQDGSSDKNSYLCPVCGAKNLKVKSDGTYNTFSCDCDKAKIRDFVSPKWTKPARAAQSRAWQYYDRDGNPLIQVIRRDDGNGGRQIYQNSCIAGKQPKELNHLVMPYRYEECLEAIEQGKLIRWAEGEGKADALWALGIAATTTIGGCQALNKLEYKGLFPDDKIVLAPDRDQPGLKYSAQIHTAYPNAKWAYFPPSDFYWDNPPASGGADVFDYIEQLKAEHKSDEEIKAIIEGAIVPMPRQPRQKVEKSTKSDRTDSAPADIKQNDEEIRQELNDINSHRDPSLDSLKQLCGEDLLNQIATLAKSLNRPVHELILTLLTVASSRIPSAVRISTPAYSEAVVLWRAIVGNSGARKTSELNIFINPLIEIESEKRKSYKQAKAEYELLLKEWEAKSEDSRGEKPVKPPELADRSPKLIFNDVTVEGMVKQLSCQFVQPTIYSDELIRIPNSFDAYRGGKGGDRQFYISAYEGAYYSKVRQGEEDSIVLESVALAMIGGIQPCKLEDTLKGSKGSGDGFWERIILGQKPPATEINYGGVKVDVFESLKSLYKRLELTAIEDYQLTREALDLHADWGTKLLQKANLEPDSMAQSVMSKATGRAIRIAAIGLFIQNATTGNTDTYISREQLAAAISLTEYALGETLKILVGVRGVVAVDKLTANITKVCDRYHGVEIGAKQITHTVWFGKKYTAEESRSLMGRMVSMGYATDNGKEVSEKSYKIIPDKHKLCNFVTSELKHPQSQTSSRYKDDITSRNFVVTFDSVPHLSETSHTSHPEETLDTGEKLQQSYKEVTQVCNLAKPSLDKNSTAKVTKLQTSSKNSHQTTEDSIAPTPPPEMNQKRIRELLTTSKRNSVTMATIDELQYALTQMRTPNSSRANEIKGQIEKLTGQASIA